MLNVVNGSTGSQSECMRLSVRWQLRVRSLVLVALFPYVIGAQARRIPDAADCVPCTIRIDTVATLKDVFYGGPATTIVRASDGSFALSDPRERTIQQRSTTGALIRQVGRAGAGPGEYQMVRNILLDRDGRIHVLDGSLGRRTVYSTNGAYISSSPLRVRGGLGWPALLTSSGQVILNTRAASPGDTHSAIVLIDSTGNPVARAEEVTGDWEAVWSHERLLTRGARGEVLVGEPFRFRVSRYNEKLERSVTYERVGRWIPTSDPADEPSDGIYEKPATARMRAIWIDAEGRLWIYATVPHRDWRAGPAQDRSANLTAEQIMELARRPRVEAVVEVVDLARQRVLVRASFPNGLGQPFGGGLFARTIETGMSETSVVVTSLHIQR